MAAIGVNTNFDGGSIEVVDISNPFKLVFSLRNDTNSKFKQWFYFQLNNLNTVKNDSVSMEDLTLTMTITGLKDSAYPDGWNNYNVCMSYDNKHWCRVASDFDGDNLTFNLKPTANSVYFAYFEPYSYARHLGLVGVANNTVGVSHKILGQTHQGRNVDLLVVGDELAQNKIWIIARQHPGETMTEWVMEGLIHKLLDRQDSISKTLLKDSVFYLVPNMNPDGAYMGNLRVNTQGVNLNREWLLPSLERSPEVYWVQKEMKKTGVDMFFDVHGDEAIPYVFTAGCQENASYSNKQAQLAEKFTHYLELVNPDYQNVFGYEKGHFSNEASSLATNWVGNEFDCLSFTIELPFKDNANLPDIIHGWNGRRSYLFGQSILIAINLVIRG